MIRVLRCVRKLTFAMLMNKRFIDRGDGRDVGRQEV